MFGKVQPGNPKRWWPFLLLLIPALIIVLWWPRNQGQGPRSGHGSNATAFTHEGFTRAGTPFRLTADPTNNLRSMAVSLRSAKDSEESRALLGQFRSLLFSRSPAEATREIQSMLQLREDVPTRLGFTLGADHYLKEAPTLRVFLLDLLGQVDPAAAADYAQTILQQMDSADEWAIALRNYALGTTNPENKRLLAQKLQAMLSNQAWQKEASVGFLEAFDVAVYVGGTSLMPSLAALARQTDNRALNHAAYLALDRLTIAQPVSTLAYLLGNPDLLQGREATRANYFARVDLRHPRQTELLQSYLLDPARGGVELATFASLFPNANYMVSPNLLTGVTTPDHATLAARDAQALRVIEQWLQDPQFAKVAPQLKQIQARLQRFVQQAKGN